MEVLFLIVGLLFAFLGALLLREQKQAIAKGRPVKGQVIGYIDGKSLNQGSTLFPIIKAHWEGETRYLRSPVGSLHPLHIPGEEVTLTVTATQPPRVAMHSRALGYVAYGFILFGLIFCGVFYATFQWNWFSLLMAAVVIGSLTRQAKTSKATAVSFKLWMNKTREALLQEWMSQEAFRALTLLPASLIMEKVKRHQRAVKAWGLLLLLGSGVAMYFGEFWIQRRHQFLQSAQRADGVIAEMDTTHSTDGFMYYPVVSFRAPASETEIKFRHSVGSSHPSYQVGEKVTVLYDPAAPKKAMIDSGVFNYFGPVLVLLGAAFFAVLGLRCLLRKNPTRAYAALDQT